jgi:hypothetical protein
MPFTKESFSPSSERNAFSYRSYISHVKERVSEISGTISKPIFESLIKFDTQRTFLTIPPLGKELDYTSALKDLARSKSLDPKVREARAKELRSEFTRQIRGMANCRLILERLIQNNPDIPKKTLDDCLKLFAARYGLPKEKLEGYLESVNSFTTLRNNIKEVRDLYPDDDILFKELLPYYHGKISGYKISTSPYEIIISTSKENIETLQPGSGGFATTSIINIKNKFVEKSLTIPVIFVPNNAGSANKFILTHEREHSKNRFIMNSSLGIKSSSIASLVIDKFKLSDLVFKDNKFLIDSLADTLKNYGNSQGLIPDNIKQMMEDLNNDPDKLVIKGAFRKNLENQVKAYDSESQKAELENAKEILRLKIGLFFFDSLEAARDEVIAMKKDGLSNYFADLGSSKNYIFYFDDIEYLFKMLQDRNLEIGITLLDVKNKFSRDITKATQAFDDLMVKGKFSRDEAIAILASVPLNSWSMVVRGLLVDIKK